MSFSKPVFNLLCDIWDQGHTPAADPPDFVDVPCQKYYYSREFDASLWYLKIRVPALWPGLSITLSPIPGGTPMVVECPKGSGHYYAIQNCAWMHQGFSNEYWALGSVRCNVGVTGTLTETLP